MKHFLILIPLFITTATFAQTDTLKDDGPVCLVEQMPSFPGGENEMMKFIIKNITYPQPERESDIGGTCYITFVVEKDGSITNVKVLRGVTNGPGIDKEALKVVSMMPNWNPGKQNGREVRVQFNLPIKMTIDASAKKTHDLSANDKKDRVTNSYYNRGVAYAKAGEYEKALDDFDSAIKLSPTDKDALYNKGYMYYKLNKTKEACETWNYLKSLGSKLADEMLEKNCK